MSDLLHQNLDTVQSNQQPMPPTIASTTTIYPANFLSFVSGTIDIQTVVPAVTGAHMICLVFTSATPGDLLTTGNIVLGSTTLAQFVPIFLIYDPISGDYYIK